MIYQMGALWKYLFSGSCAPALNMAIDEALLWNVVGLGCPVLRFYSWTEPAATFGYSQKFEEVARWTQLRPLLRRPTGGGVVPHLSDWTYAIAIPPGNPWYSLSADLSYQRLHGWMQKAFTRLGIHTELAPMPRQGPPGQCFVGADQHDLLWEGRKIAGAAQRRKHLGLLIQGSVQFQPMQIERHSWEQALLEVAALNWDVKWEEISLDPQTTGLAVQLAANKYSTNEYNQRR